jgi:AmiR/NasT family two-component response regulator
VCLLTGTRCVGAIKIYSAQPGTFDEAAASRLEKLAAPAALLLDSLQTSETARRFSEALAAALISRDNIARAQGILMERDGAGPDSALQKILQLARTAGQSMSVISTDMITGRRDSSLHRT